MAIAFIRDLVTYSSKTIQHQTTGVPLSLLWTTIACISTTQLQFVEMKVGLANF